MMKKIAAIMTMAVVTGTMSASAELLVGWETWGPTPLTGQFRNVAASTNAADITGNVFIPGQVGLENVWTPNSNLGDATGTFGTLAGASTDIAAFNSNLYGNPLSATGNTYLDFTITYTGTQSLQLDSFHFDGAQGGNQSTRTWSVEALSGSVTLGVIAGPTLLPNFNGLSEQDIGLTGLADRVLAAGESATFRMTFVGNANGGNGQRLDNVAFAGTVIPEPATLGLIAVMGGGLLFVRRRFTI